MATEHQNAGQLVIDPVCGMKVDPKIALSAEYQDRTFYFCSNHCKTRFLQNPEMFLAPKSSSPKSEEDGCCHGGAAPQTASLQLSSPAKTKGKYTCPMHPEIVQDHPGDCPKCGMA